MTHSTTVRPADFQERRHLVIGGRPRLLLGGQLHNSTSSDLPRAAEAFDRVVALGGNAVTATVSWHLIEPEEGAFHFDGVDFLVCLARERGLALTLLWFGAFKNAASTYAPRWVRADPSRFPRAEPVDDDGEPTAFSRPGTPVLSVFSAALLEADRRAFATLAQHLSLTGASASRGGPLIMIQVENETGLLGAPRDGAKPALAAWGRQVPVGLIDWLTEHPGARGTAASLWRENGSRREGTWAEVFGEGTGAAETFMAWGFSSYCEALAKAGASVLDVLYYANAWIGPQPNQEEPGQYPSGGPVAGQLDVWRAGAPTLAFLGPDLYVGDVEGGMRGYLREDNPVLIPESRLAVGNVFHAVGSGAIGFNVFGVDDVRSDGQIAAAYTLLRGAEDVIVAAQREGRIRPILLEAGEEVEVELGGLCWTLRGAADALRCILLDAGVQVRTDPVDVPSETLCEALVPSLADTRAMGVLISLSEDEVLLIGQGLMLDVAVSDGGCAEVDDAWEGRYEAGCWVPGRNLNGDERLSLLPIDRLAAVRVKILRRR